MTVRHNDRSNSNGVRTTAVACPYCAQPLEGEGENGGNLSLAVHLRRSCSGVDR